MVDLVEVDPIGLVACTQGDNEISFRCYSLLEIIADRDHNLAPIAVI